MSEKKFDEWFGKQAIKECEKNLDHGYLPLCDSLMYARILQESGGLNYD